MRDKRSASGEKKNGANELRRTEPGVRTASDYFAPDRQHREVKRGELLSFLSSIEWHRRQNRWYVRLWRRLRGGPPVANMPKTMAHGHEQTLDQVKERLLAERSQQLVKAELPIEHADD